MSKKQAYQDIITQIKENMELEKRKVKAMTQSIKNMEESIKVYEQKMEEA